MTDLAHDTDRPTVLVIDDEAPFRDFAAQVIDGLGYQALPATTPAAGIELAGKVNPAAILLDLQMPGCDGIEVLHALAGMGCRARIVLASGFDSRVLHTALQVGRDLGLKMGESVMKPVALEAFEAVLRAVVQPTGLDPERLKRAIDDGELVLHYQPKIDLRDASAPPSVEALVRWQHPELGLLPPDRFLPLAVESGQLGALTFVVLDQALAQMAAWSRDGLEVQVAINVSPELFEDRELPGRIPELAAAYGVDPAQLVLEVVETAALDDHRTAIDTLTRLRLRGIGLAIDDFGTGHSSLLLLYRMPFSELKVDRSFVTRIDSDGEAQTIVKASIDLAHNLKMRACIEGVETAAALELVRALGADSVQGYYFSRPLPADRIPGYYEVGQPDAECGSLAVDVA